MPVYLLARAPDAQRPPVWSQKASNGQYLISWDDFSQTVVTIDPIVPKRVGRKLLYSFKVAGVVIR
jgi:hypothetical protein